MQTGIFWNKLHIYYFLSQIKQVFFEIILFAFSRKILYPLESDGVNVQDKHREIDLFFH